MIVSWQSTTECKSPEQCVSHGGPESGSKIAPPLPVLLPCAPAPSSSSLNAVLREAVQPAQAAAIIIPETNRAVFAFTVGSSAAIISVGPKFAPAERNFRTGKTQARKPDRPLSERASHG